MQESEMYEGGESKASPVRRVGTYVGLSVLLALATTLVLVAMNRNRGGGGVGSDDPCNLRLEYVRPDCGTTLYDAQGCVREGVLPVLISGHERTWSSDRLMREFVFRCRVPEENALFPSMVHLSLNGRSGTRVMSRLQVLGKEGPWVTLYCRAKLPREGIPRFLGLGPLVIPMGREATRSVDMHLTYHAGPRAEAAATFVGPFRVGQRIVSEADPNFVMDVGPRNFQGVCYTISGPPLRDSEAPCIAYNADGRRILLERRGGGASSSRGFSWEYQCQGLLPENTQVITLAEAPVQKNFYGITVSYPDQPERVYPASWDKAFARVSAASKGRSGAVHFAQQTEPLASMSDAIRILDVAQGRVFTRVLNTLKQGSVDDLTDDEQARLREILNLWFNSGPKVSASYLAKWTGWPKHVDRAIAVLREGDLGDRSMRALASELCQSGQPLTPEQVVAVTELLLTRNICDPHARRDMVRSVMKHAGSQADLLTRLAECDKPWIWGEIIQPTRAFSDYKKAVPLSRTIQVRAVALGMDDWVDQAESLKSEASALLGTLITPEFVQKDISEFMRVFKRFAKETAAEAGTPVLIDYVQDQLNQWHTWQVSGYTSHNHSGISSAVQQLNAWHGLNLGGLGCQRETHNDEHNYDWTQIARSALYWSRTQEDQSDLPRDWQVSDQDLRVVWLNELDRERSVIGLWLPDQDPDYPIPPLIMEMADDFLHYSVTPDSAENSPPSGYSLSIRAGVSRAHSVNRTFGFVRSELPRVLDPGPTNMSSTSETGVSRATPLWQGAWEIWVEPASSQDSVLGDSPLFSAWKARYLGVEIAGERPRIFKQDNPDTRLDYILSRRDYGDMSDMEIALRHAMDLDPLLSSDELKAFKKENSRTEAVTRYQALLKRSDLSVEVQIFVWYRIARLSHTQSRDGDPAENEALAREALDKAQALDPNWLSGTSLNVRWRRLLLIRKPAQQFSAYLDMYQWLLDRERDMLEDALARPTIVTSPRAVAVIAPPLLGSETVPLKNQDRARQRLYKMLQGSFRRCETILDMHLRGNQPLSKTELNRHEELKARFKEHWVNHPI